ncbi:MAG: DUF7501 family protein [Thermoplasmatota archaeon]
MHEICMFCSTDLGEGWDPHLAFLRHVEGKPTCDRAWHHWMDNIASDWAGD